MNKDSLFWLDVLEKKKTEIKVIINKINKEKIEEFCEKQKDILALQKMKFHELVKEPVENIITISQDNLKKIKKDCLQKLLNDLGYNTRLYFSRDHRADLKAAMSINGYFIPGWNLLIRLIKIFSPNKALFLNRKFSPGRSRLHIRLYEGNKYWYITAHIDKYNFFHYNFFGVIKHHYLHGQGDYKKGTEFFLTSLSPFLLNKPSTEKKL